MMDATARCHAFETAARQEAALQAVQDGTDASDTGYLERFVRVAVLQERFRASRQLAGAALAAPLPPPPPLPTSETPFYEARAEAAYAKRASSQGEAPLVDVRGESYRRVLRDCPVVSRSDARALARAAARGMVGAFRSNGSTTLGCAAPEALRGRLDDHTIATIRRCVVELRRLAAESAGVDERRLALSGAFLARLQKPGASSKRRALEAPKPRGYWNPHVDEFNVDSYEHTTLLYLSDHATDFTGGRIVFHDGDGVDRYLEPSAGAVICFRGDATNLHAVERVASGCRFALTALFHESDEAGPLFEDSGGAGDPYASWDALLRSAAETSLMAQDPRRRDLLDDALATPVAARLAADLRSDWCDARVAYAGDAAVSEPGAPDAVLVDLVAAALRTGDDGAFDVFGDSDSTDDDVRGRE